MRSKSNTSKEAIWRNYIRATRMQYIATLVTLHRACGFGSKRLHDFEDALSEVIDQISSYAKDDVLIDKLGDEFKELGYDIRDLLVNGRDLTFSEMTHQQKLNDKKTMAEIAEAAKKIQASGFYKGGKT